MEGKKQKKKECKPLRSIWHRHSVFNKDERGKEEQTTRKQRSRNNYQDAS